MSKKPRGCGGYAWWSSQTCAPVRVYVYGARPVSENTSYIIQLNGKEYDAVESDLFDTEEEALEVCIKRIDKEIDDMNAAVDTLMRHRSEDKARLDALSAGGPKSWSTVTTSAVLSGSNTSRNNITVVGNGVLEIKDGATVTQLTIKDGGSCNVENAQIEDVHVYNGATLNLSGSSTLYNAKVDSQAELWVADSAVASTITISSGGSTFVRHHGTVKLTKIGSWGFLSVRDTNASAIRVTVSSGGKLSVSQDAYIANCLVESAGVLVKHTPYTIENLNVKSGGLDI